MTIREIPPEQWCAFLGDFRQRHAGWTATLELHQPGRGTLVWADNRSFQDLLTESAERHRTISVVLGNLSNTQLTHVVDDATRLRVNQTEAGADEDLEIDAADGSLIVIHLHAPVRAQTAA
jgi:hypothetical protein